MIELVEEGSALAQLPVVRWARRFQQGTVRLQGNFTGATIQELQVDPGELEIAFTFVGKPDPRILELALVGQMRVGERAGTAIDFDDEHTLLDGHIVGEALRMDHVVEAVLEGLSDVAAWVEAFPDGELIVKFPAGVQASLSGSAVVTLEGAAEGPPGHLRLSQPLQMRVDGEGLCLTHRRFHRLANLASVRIEEAVLHPNGEVRLRGGANGALNRVVRGGLKRASARLSDLVRRSPRFARVRTFLDG